MKHLITLLETALQTAIEVAAADAEALQEMKAAHERELAEKTTALIIAYEKKLEDTREGLANAQAFWGRVEAEEIGWLPTANLPARMLYEKLAARWENLSASDVQFLDEYLDGVI